jgi:hypothetical protein
MKPLTPPLPDIRRASMVPMPWAGHPMLRPLYRLLGYGTPQPPRAPSDTRPLMLRRVALLVLCGHGLFAFYLVVPTLAPRGFTLDWTEPLTFAALLGIGAVFWLRQRDRMVSHGTPATRAP